MKYNVVEVYDSVQGEGSMMGYPVTFIRLAGCNLRCPWCDTKESWEVPAGELMTVEEIVELCNHNLAVITGGEPCMQDLDDLIYGLRTKEIFVAIETNGTLPTPAGAEWVTCSPKPPEYHIHEDCAFDEIKLVVDSKLTEEKVLEVANMVKERNPEMFQITNVWLQPEGNEVIASAARATEMVMNHPTLLRLGIQMHKALDIK